MAKFFELAKAGETDAIMALLAPDSEFWPDGGGKVSVASQSVILDPLRTARFFAGLWSSPKSFQGENVLQEPGIVNGRPGWIVSIRDEAGIWHFNSLMSFEIENGKVARIFVQRNPDKMVLL